VIAVFRRPDLLWVSIEIWVHTLDTYVHVLALGLCVATIIPFVIAKASISIAQRLWSALVWSIALLLDQVEALPLRCRPGVVPLLKK
jgi:hypothetical protein